MKNALLDTDACIEVIRGNPTPLDSFLNFTFIVSVITRFEILSGLKGRKGTKVEKRAISFLQAANIHPFDDIAADAAAKIRIDLETKGQPIGAYDLLLAGHATSLNIPIITGNQKEFKRVLGLEILSYR